MKNTNRFFSIANQAAFCILPLSLLIGLKINTICIILFLLLIIFNSWSSILEYGLRALRNMWTYAFISIFLVQVATFFLRGDEHSLIKSVDTQLSLFLLPLFIQVYFSIGYDIRIMFKMFSYAVIAIGVSIILYSLLKEGHYDFESIIRIIPHGHIYYGMLTCFAGAFFLTKFKEKTWAGIPLIMTSLALFILIMLGSRTMSFAFLGIVILFIILDIKKGNRIHKYLLFVALIVVLFTSYSVIMPRFGQLINDKSHNPLYIRSISWDCGFQVFKENIWFGVGNQEVSNAMYDCYKATRFWDKSLNPHNEFIASGAKYGVFGFISFTILVLTLLINAIKSKRELYLYFVLIIILASTFESILDRQAGVVFLSYFASVFFFENHGYRFN